MVFSFGSDLNKFLCASIKLTFIRTSNAMHTLTATRTAANQIGENANRSMWPIVSFYDLYKDNEEECIHFKKCFKIISMCEICFFFMHQMKRENEINGTKPRCGSQLCHQ